MISLITLQNCWIKENVVYIQSAAKKKSTLWSDTEVTVTARRARVYKGWAEKRTVFKSLWLAYMLTQKSM